LSVTRSQTAENITGKTSSFEITQYSKYISTELHEEAKTAVLVEGCAALAFQLGVNSTIRISDVTLI
jgi:hypothetical protein